MSSGRSARPLFFLWSLIFSLRRFSARSCFSSTASSATRGSGSCARPVKSTPFEYAELRLMTVALLGHGQLRADQVREVALQLLDPPFRVRAVVRSHLPV